MGKRISAIIPFFLLLVFVTGCKHEPGKNVDQEPDMTKLQEPLVNVNKQLVNTEDSQIKNLIQRYGWNMSETGTGLRYLIYHHGDGQKIQKDKTISIRYELRLINGDLVYSSKESGPKEFKVGSGGVESGLEEAVLLLRVGDKAKLILPSHLAWGLIGDQDKIPPKSTLIYDVEVIAQK